MRRKLAPERKSQLIREIQGHFAEHWDEPIGELKAELLLEFFLAELGPQVYNQAIQDALAFLQEKLADLEGEFYEFEEGGAG